MKAVDFYKLPRAIQDRFVGSVMSGFPPAPILASKGAVPTKLIWVGSTAVCLIGLVVTTRLGYGALESGLSLHSGKALPLYLGLTFGFAFGLVQAFARLVRERALPYTSGVYLFPACLIDARDDTFKIYETKDLQTVDAQGGAIRIAFRGGASFLFPLKEPAAAATLVADVQAARDRAIHSHATEDPGELVAVDPLHNPRFSSPVGPRDPYAMRMPPWGKLGPVVAGVFGLAFGPTIWALRNNGSDKTMYAAATRANDAASYRAYLEHGEKFKTEVAATDLPRAELQDAVKAGTVDALLEFKKNHPDTQIGPEIAVSIRAAMLSELETAKAPGTLTALKDFAARYPEHGVEPELKEATHAIYTRELNAFKAKVPAGKDKASVLAFADKLFAWAERSGSARVEVRFRRKAVDLGRADQLIAHSPNFMGVATYPSRFYDEKNDTKREQALGKSLATRLDGMLSAELFDVQMAANVPDQDLPPDVRVPTLFVTHGTEWAGQYFNPPKPRGMFVGLTFTYEAVFQVPGDPKPFKFKWDVQRVPHSGVIKDEDGPIGTAEATEKIYDAMADGAYDAFGEKLVGQFFKAEKVEK
jgi:hypothetical protein